MPQILWIGCLESDEEFKIKAKKGYDLASAQVSQKNLLYGIEEVSSIVCDSINGSVLPPYPVYQDRIIAPVTWEHKLGAMDISVGYKNDKYINRVNCKKAMLKAADEWCKTRYKGSDVIVFVYSMRSAPMATACRIKEKIPQAKIYLIITDLPQFMDLGQSRVKAALKKIDWQSIKKMQKKFDGFILYAEKMAEYLEIPSDKWILMEGSYDTAEQITAVKGKKKAVMYSGKLDEQYVYASKYCDFKWINDETHLKLLYKGCFGRKLDLEDPQLFNEKLQWLKIHDRKPRYIQLVDKYEVKKYIAEKLGEEYVIPTLGVWEDANEIDFDKLPERFVLKCTHDSHSIVICTDKSKLDIEKSKRSLNKALKRNYFYDGRQWPYKGVKPRIIAEAYMEDSFGELRDYKFTCFDGKVDNVMLCYDRASGDTKFYFFSPEWKLLRINKRGLAAPENFSVPKPENMDEMFRIAGLLSQGIPYARVDLYNINGKIYFGEITLYPQSGFDTNLLKETDEDFGRKIDLSKVKG